MNLSEIGEFGLIDTLAGLVKAGRSDNASWNNLVLGIGDDAAAWRCGSGAQLGTIDALVEGVHFNLGMISWEELGWKSLAINVSDIAAMGGSPRYALVSLALPPDTQVDDVVSFYRGMLDLAATLDLVVAGGNISRAPIVSVNVAVLGEEGPTGRLLTRSAAKMGDMIAVTGCLGGAAAGLRLLEDGRCLDPRTADALRRAFLRPMPRVKEGLILAEHGVRAAIDLSDGLVSDLGHVCKASVLGARVNLDSLPLAAGVEDNFPGRALAWGLSGGEDYELLFTAPGSVMAHLKAKLGCPATVIGQMISDSRARVTLLDSHGGEFNLTGGGWDHFVGPSAAGVSPDEVHT
jgi:thiamine-monophosphate kinase